VLTRKILQILEIKLSIPTEASERRSSAPKEDKEKREKGKLGGTNKGGKASTFWCYGMVLMLRSLSCNICNCNDHFTPPSLSNQCRVGLAMHL